MPQFGLCVWHFGDAAGKVVQQYLRGTECKEKKCILNLVGIEDLLSMWADYHQSYNLGRLIWLQDVALEREKAVDQWEGYYNDKVEML